MKTALGTPIPRELRFVGMKMVVKMLSQFGFSKPMSESKIASDVLVVNFTGSDR